MGARNPGKDPVPAPGRTSQPTTRIKPKTPPASAPTTSGSGSGTTGSGSGSTGGGTRPTTPPGNSAASANPGYERRTPTGPELRAAQAARAAAPKVLPFKEKNEWTLTSKYNIGKKGEEKKTVDGNQN